MSEKKELNQKELSDVNGGYNYQYTAKYQPLNSAYVALADELEVPGAFITKDECYSYLCNTCRQYLQNSSNSSNIAYFKYTIYKRGDKIESNNLRAAVL